LDIAEPRSLYEYVPSLIVRCSVIDLHADQDQPGPFLLCMGLFSQFCTAGPPARICPDPVLERNTLRQAVLDIDGMSKPKKEIFFRRMGTKFVKG
jgi:hypothetical protein